jgi:hypothetical protein
MTTDLAADLDELDAMIGALGKEKGCRTASGRSTFATSAILYRKATRSVTGRRSSGGAS